MQAQRKLLTKHNGIILKVTGVDENQCRLKQQRRKSQFLYMVGCVRTTRSFESLCHYLSSGRACALPNLSEHDEGGDIDEGVESQDSEPHKHLAPRRLNPARAIKRKPRRIHPCAAAYKLVRVSDLIA